MAGWRKDGAEVDRTRDPNFIQTSDGHLLIQQARMEDAANYTCVAANAAGLERVSPPARVTVYGKRGITGKREIGWSCLCISESFLGNCLIKTGPISKNRRGQDSLSLIWGR